MWRPRLRRLADLVCRAAVDRDWVPRAGDLRRLEGLDGAVVVNRVRHLKGKHEGYDADQIWTPDGEYLIFTSDRDGAANLYRKRADGSGDESPVARRGPGDP